MAQASTIYLVMDMINDLVHEDSPVARKRYRAQIESKGMLDNTAEALRKARAAGVPVGYVRIGFAPDYRDCPPNSRLFGPSREAGIFKLGTWGTQVHPSIAPRPEDFDIVKHRVSPFYGTELEVVLRTLGVKRIVLSGISTTGVVHSGVREGHDRDYDLVVLEDCCCALDEEQHRFVINGMKAMARIATARDFSFET
jgi:nicotinamidase-related amidase